MLEFRNDMLKLAQKYPDIRKVVVSKQLWSVMCGSFDNMLGEKQGSTEAHIKEKSGSMRFDEMIVEPENEE